MEPNEVASILSQSIAPVFLITNAASLIGIMAMRYGRVIDRIRTLLRDGGRLYDNKLSFEHVSRELKALSERARLLRCTIILAVVSVIFVSMTVVTIFVGFTTKIEMANLTLVLFVASLFALMTALIFFIQDFVISLRSITHDINARSTVLVNSAS